MGKRPLLLLALAVAFLASYEIARTQPPKDLDVYFVDVEGGQATLVVSPSGQSMLIDAGSPGDRDADRIVAVAKQAGLRQIDYMGRLDADADSTFRRSRSTGAGSGADDHSAVSNLCRADR